MDYENLALRLGLETEEFMELVSLYVETTTQDLDRIRQGLARGSAPDTAAAAHSIKGAAANMGFSHMARLAEAMETQARDGELTQLTPHLQQFTRLMDELNPPNS
ncbi:MAG: Hpt domain-containing protein [Desulfobacterales bacterium]|nr:Hpt domain-containing protein [Desulfobacterales bacterium]